MIWMFMSTPNSSVKILTLKVMKLRDRAFGRIWGHRGGAFRMELVPLYKRPQRALLPIYHVETQQEDAIYELQSGPKAASTLILEFPAYWTVRYKLLFLTSMQHMVFCYRSLVRLRQHFGSQHRSYNFFWGERKLLQGLDNFHVYGDYLSSCGMMERDFIPALPFLMIWFGESHLSLKLFICK